MRWEPHHLPQLDGLRSLAVGLVLAYHLVRVDGRSVLPGAFLGVDVFFVLSGFLITSLLLAEQRAEGRLHLLAFYRRRFWRLYPGLVVVVLATVAFFLLVPSPADPEVAATARNNPESVLLALTYLFSWAFALGWEAGPSALGHTWSLSIEEHFYLVWPLVLVVLLHRRRPHLLGWTAALTAVAACWPLALRLLSDPTADRIYAGPDTRASQLLVGALLAVVLARPEGLGRLRWLASPAATVLGLALLVLPLLGAHRTGQLYLTGGQTVISLGTALVLIHLVLRRSAATRLLSTRVPVALGRWSYGIYLWHVPLMLLAPEVVGRGATASAVAGLACVPLAALSYRVVEQPLLRRYGGRRTAPVTAAGDHLVPQQGGPDRPVGSRDRAAAT